jgi:hypothetical protein
MSSLRTFIPSNSTRSQLREIISIKDAVIFNLINENKSLQSRINELEHDKILFKSIIENNRKMEKLAEDNKQLDKQIMALENEVKELKQNKMI